MTTMPIKQFEDGYAISTNGKVFSLKSGRFLKCSLCTQGYPMAKLFRGIDPSSGKRLYKYVRVHRLVGEHFIPNPNDHPYLNHIDGNKQNPSASNLEWCTASENSKHAFATGLTPKKEKLLSSLDLQKCTELYASGVGIQELAKNYGVSRSAVERNIHLSDFGRNLQNKVRGEKCRAAHSKKVAQLNMNGELIQIWDSYINAANALGLRQGNISNAVCGRAKSSGGFRWKSL